MQQWTRARCHAHPAPVTWISNSTGMKNTLPASSSLQSRPMIALCMCRIVVASVWVCVIERPCIHIYICIYIYIDTNYTHPYTQHTYMYTYIPTYIHTYVHEHVYYINVYTQARIYVLMYICIHIVIGISMHICLLLYRSHQALS